MAQSATDVCNSALQKVGAARILSLTDNSREARSCAVAYDSNRRDELRKHPWNFAIKRVLLAPDATAPAFGFKYQYTLPSDCLRVLLPKDNTLDWVVEGNKILTNLVTSPAGVDFASGVTGLALRYIADVTDPVLWDATFYNVMAVSLAIDICDELTQSNQKKQALAAEYNDSIKQAKLMDSFENLPAEAPDSDFITVRML